MLSLAPFDTKDPRSRTVRPRRQFRNSSSNFQLEIPSQPQPLEAVSDLFSFFNTATRICTRLVTLLTLYTSMQILLKRFATGTFVFPSKAIIRFGWKHRTRYAKRFAATYLLPALRKSGAMRVPPPRHFTGEFHGGVFKIQLYFLGGGTFMVRRNASPALNLRFPLPVALSLNNFRILKHTR